ncbi:SCO family protein [Nocardioides sp. zg-579]|uniref:SCO family protein n=1 Tax=Nocardioides marmotae TaxID=2663857 RepID=A0A6I3JBZ5_9ACTN|nr:SCO family protein [Nocardioides marmotae]MCR6032006.1 SCO family protein [Gordonia jinghuaiqii]MTB95647.1 SCO family protein [Nocardioides marmotae]QKE01060.1 SCO family protein [Nocardioides marmotae]
MARRARLRTTLAASLAAALLLTGCGGGGEEQEVTGSVVDPPFEVAATPMKDTDGKPFSLAEDTDARLTLVFFGYTQCPDVCPLVMQTLTSGLNKLDDAEREQVEVVFVTTDPATDTGPVLRDYLDRFDPSYVGVRGDLETTKAVAESVGVFVADGEELASGGYDLGSHGTYVIAVDGNDRAPMFWRQSTSAAQFAHDVSSLLGDA